MKFLRWLCTLLVAITVILLLPVPAASAAPPPDAAGCVYPDTAPGEPSSQPECGDPQPGQYGSPQCPIISVDGRGGAGAVKKPTSQDCGSEQYNKELTSARVGSRPCFITVQGQAVKNECRAADMPAATPTASPTPTPATSGAAGTTTAPGVSPLLFTYQCPSIGPNKRGGFGHTDDVTSTDCGSEEYKKQLAKGLAEGRNCWVKDPTKDPELQVVRCVAAEAGATEAPPTPTLAVGGRQANEGKGTPAAAALAEAPEACKSAATIADLKACKDQEKEFGFWDCVWNIIDCALYGIAVLVRDMNVWILENVVKMWIGQPSASPENNATGWMVRGALSGIALVVAIASIIWQGIVMIMTRKANPLLDIGRGLFLMILWASLGMVGVTAALKAGDNVASWILEYPDHFTSETGLGGVPDDPSVAQLRALYGGDILGNAILIIIFGIVMFFVSLIQGLIMAFREGTLVLLTGTLVLAAAGSMTQSTRTWLPKVMSWMLALICYKPVAALAYASSFFMLSSAASGGGARQMIMGVALLIVSIVALPALMKLFTVFSGRIEAGGGIAALGGALGTMALYSKLRDNGGGAAAGAATGAKDAADNMTRDLQNPSGPSSPGGASPTGGPRPDGGGGPGGHPGGYGATNGGGNIGSAPAGVAAASTAQAAASQAASSGASSASSASTAQAAAAQAASSGNPASAGQPPPGATASAAMPPASSYNMYPGGGSSRPPMPPPPPSPPPPDGAR